MPEEIKTCQGLAWVGDYTYKKCNRPLYDDEHCICHSNDLDKDIGKFGAEVQKQLSRKDCHDFFFFVFPKDYSFNLKKFSNGANFESAKFIGYANFRGAKFNSEANFKYSRFEGDGDFGHAEFTGETNFRNATFAKTANFNRIKLGKEAIVKFDGEKSKLVFQGDTDFRNIDIGNASFIFRKINLGKCEFLETDLTKVEFIDVGWAKTSGVGKWFKTNAVYDAVKTEEIFEKYDYRLIAQVYRRLQINYIDNCHYGEAGDFHIGEQEMMRKGKGTIRRYFCTNMIYKIVSNYGESFSRPLLWLLFFLFLFPAIFLYSGIDITPPDQQEDKKDMIVQFVNYEFSANVKDCLLFNQDYWDAFVMPPISQADFKRVLWLRL